MSWCLWSKDDPEILGVLILKREGRAGRLPENRVGSHSSTSTTQDWKAFMVWVRRVTKYDVFYCMMALKALQSFQGSYLLWRHFRSTMQLYKELSAQRVACFTHLSSILFLLWWGWRAIAKRKGNENFPGRAAALTVARSLLRPHFCSICAAFQEESGAAAVPYSGIMQQLKGAHSPDPLWSSVEECCSLPFLVRLI